MQLGGAAARNGRLGGTRGERADGLRRLVGSAQTSPNDPAVVHGDAAVRRDG